jgi:hypothetical protein
MAPTTASSLQRVGEDRIAAVAAALELARAELEHRAQVEPAREFGQGGLAHQAGAGAGQLPLVGLGPACMQGLGHDQVDQGVAQELQALVVGRPDAAMSQRLAQQGRVGESVADRVSHRRYDCRVGPNVRT